MIRLLRKVTDLFRILSAQERRQMVVVFLCMLLTGIFEVAGVGSVVPFLAVAGKPDIITTNHWTAGIYQALGFHQPEEFIVALGLAVIAFLVVSNAVKAAVFAFTIRFVKLRMVSLTTKLFRHLLLQPYYFFLDRNSSDILKSILEDLPQVLENVLDAALDLISKVIIIIGLVALVTVSNPIIALVAIVLLGAVYLLMFGSVRKALGQKGSQSDTMARERYRMVSEAFGGVKEVKFSTTEEHYLADYDRVTRKQFLNDSSRDVLGTFPRYFLEVVAFGGIIAIVLVYIAGGKDLTDVLPLLGLYAFSGYRLMPYLQLAYGDIVKIRYASARLDRVLESFASGEQNPPEPQVDMGRNLKLEREIRVKDLTFRYPRSDKPVLDCLNLTIPVKSTVGLVGSSGAGKSTLVDLLLGLLDLPPHSVFLDDQPLELELLPSWKAKVGYVPQSIYLKDDTIASNIAFGVSVEQIDWKHVETAARMAKLHDFIQRELPSGYETLTGERGVQLSGGQRQRIGIARALYRNPEVLILDEATSALDGVTETEIMDAIHNLGKSMTIIIVAHRLTTLKACDNIFVLDSGRVVDQGTYSALMETNAQFREMAGQGKKA